MKDRHTQSDDWISEWIARQRDTLSQPQAKPTGESTGEDPADVLRRWLGAVQTVFTGATDQGSNASGAGAAFADPFNVGNTLLAAWAGAGLFRAGLAQQTADLLGKLPPIGLVREQTQAWRELMAAHAYCQQVEHELRAVLSKVQLDALDLLHERVRQRGTAEPINDTRALYDLWVECAEQVYNKLAHSDAYSKLQAELGNATMRLRMRLQAIVEHWLKQLDLPTRSEVNSLHRQVRELRLQLEQLTAAQPKQARAAAPQRKAQSNRARSNQAPSRKAKTRQPTTRKAASRRQ